MNDAADVSRRSRSRWELSFRLFLAATLIAWLLLSVWGGLHLGIVWSQAYFIVLTFEASLLGLWVGFGRWHWRLPIAFCFGLLLSLVAAAVYATNAYWEFLTYVMGTLCVVAITTYALRLGKGALQTIEQGDRLHDYALQFGIKQLLIWTAVIAVLNALGRVVLEFAARVGGSQLSTNDLTMIFGLAFFVSVATVANVWALLQLQVSPVRVAILVLVVFAAGDDALRRL